MLLGVGVFGQGSVPHQGIIGFLLRPESGSSSRNFRSVLASQREVPESSVNSESPPNSQSSLKSSSSSSESSNLFPAQMLSGGGASL